MRKLLFSLISFGVLLLPFFASAHVRYIAGASEVQRYSGLDFHLLFSPFANLAYVFLMVGIGLLFICLILYLPRIPFFARSFAHIEQKALREIPLIGWMLRLALGIGLIGAGVAHDLISPALSGFSSFSSIQILLGFLLLSGFLIVPAVLGSLLLYFIALQTDFYMLGSLEILGIGVALLMLDSRRPGVDDILNIPSLAFTAAARYTPVILRWSIGVGMFFLAIYEKILNPDLAAYVVNATNLTHVVSVSPAMWVLGAGLVESLIGILLILGIRVRLVSVIAFFVLSLSFFYFKEDVASHITLFGVLSVLFVTGGKKIELQTSAPLSA